MRKELTIMTLSGLVALSSMPGASPVYAVNNNSIDDLAESIRSKSAKTIYVEEKNGNTYVADGSSNKPYKDIKTAIEKAEDGDTLIIVGSASYTKYDKDDVGAALPLFINKKITIQGNNSSSSLSSRAPIQLGADVTFKDISLEMVPEVILGRQASGSESRILGNKNPRAATIFAAGHKLTLNNVTTKVGNNTDDDRPYISGGTYKKHDSNIGSKSIINIINGRDETKFAAIYAGDYWTDRNMNVEINIDGKVQVLDQKIHAGGFDFDLNGTVDINIKGSNNIKNIEKNNYSGNINVTLKSSNDIYDIYELNFNGIHDLTLENKVRLVIPENGQFEVDNVTLGQKSRIDFRNMVKQENVTNNPTINGNLYGVTTSSNAEQYGCILVGNTQTLEIEGNVTGITKLNVGTSADSIDKFVMEHQYIKASENSEGTFSIEGTTEQKCEVKRSVENNKTVWTIVESEESEDPFGRFEWNGGDNKIVIPTLLESNAPLEYEYAIKFMDTNGQEYDVNKEFGYLNDNFTYILENSDGVFDLEQYDGADLIWDEFNPKIILCIYPEEKIDDLYGSYKLSVIHNRTSAKISKNISIVRESDQLTELTGTVSITGQAIEGNTISADISQLPSNCEGIKYEWYIDDKVVSGAEEKSFKLTSKHIGKSVKVKVTADNYSGSILSDSVIVEEKQPEVADKVDKSELKDLYDKCISTGYKESDYTEESFKAYENAIKEAESVLNKEDSTQEEVDAVLGKLRNSINALKKKPQSNSGSNNTGSSSSGGSSNSGSSSGGSSGGSSSSGSSSGSSTSTENTTNDKKEDTKVDQNSNTKPEEKKTDWDSKDGNWYVKLEDGSNAKGWYKDEGSGKWYMFDKETGAMKTGWQKDDNGKWYHLSSSGEMNTGWYKDSNNKWYKLDNSGAMVTGWHKDNNGKWYHLNNSGEMNTGWYKDSNNKWYNLDSSGAMVTGWLKDNNGKWYYLNSDGSMAANTTIDGYKLGSDGAWIR